MRPRLDVYGKPVGAGLGESRKVGIHRRDHQMHVERLLRMRSDRRDDVWPHGDIGHEMPVHDVDVNPVPAGCVRGVNLLAEPGKVGGKDRRRYEGLAHHGRSRPNMAPMAEQCRC